MKQTQCAHRLNSFSVGDSEASLLQKWENQNLDIWYGMVDIRAATEYKYDIDMQTYTVWVCSEIFGIDVKNKENKMEYLAINWILEQSALDRCFFAYIKRSYIGSISLLTRKSDGLIVCAIYSFLINFL